MRGEPAARQDRPRRAMGIGSGRGGIHFAARPAPRRCPRRVSVARDPPAKIAGDGRDTAWETVRPGARAAGEQLHASQPDGRRDGRERGPVAYGENIIARRAPDNAGLCRREWRRLR